MDTHVCERCQMEHACIGERYCKACKKELLKEMRASGYLGPRVRQGPGRHRTPDERENQKETRRGIDDK